MRTEQRAGGNEEYHMLDHTSSRVHQHVSGRSVGGSRKPWVDPRPALSIEMHFACDTLGYPLGFIVTGANVSAFAQTKP